VLSSVAPCKTGGAEVSRSITRLETSACLPGSCPLLRSVSNTSDMPRHLAVILRDASVTRRGCDFDIIGYIFMYQRIIRDLPESARFGEGGVSTRQSHNSFAAGNLCSTIQGFLSITIELFKRSCSPMRRFPPVAPPMLRVPKAVSTGIV